jgi:hypothetical protein
MQGHGMAIIVYWANKDSDQQRFLERMSFTESVICRTVEELRHHLNTPGGMRKVVILSIRDQPELAGIAKLLALYSDLLLLVILDHDLPEMNRTVFALRPRYIAYRDDDFRNFAEVLHRLIHYYIGSL